MRAIFCACLAAVALPAGVRAGPLTYGDAIGQAASGAPSTAAARLGSVAARSAARAAGALPDPRLSLGVDNFPVSGPPALSFSRDDMTMGRVGLEQDVPNLAKRRAARALARADIGVAAATESGQLRQARLGAALAWLDLAYAERRVAAVSAVIDRLRPLSDAVASGVASGSVRAGQTLAIRQDIAMLEDRRDEQVANAARARTMLSRWTGDPAPEIRGNVPMSMVSPAQLRQTLDQHPDILMADANRVRADGNVSAAQADKRPDWGFDVAYQRRDPRYGDMISAGVKIGLPLFATNRQDPIIAARAAEAGRAIAQREDARRTLLADLEAGLADHLMHHEQWMRSRDTLLPLARQRADLEQASYGAGRANLADIAEAQNALAEAELVALDREADVARDAARLTITFGSDDR